jgi:hypothetical protein
MRQQAEDRDAAAAAVVTAANLRTTRRDTPGPTLRVATTGSVASMADWEIFKRNRAPAVKGPAVTLMHRGQLSLNDAAFAELGSPKAVELMFSRANRLIGIRPVDPNEPHAYIPRTPAKQKGRGPYIISGAAFLTHFGIAVPETTRYMVALEGDTLIIDLKQSGIPVTSSQSRPASKGNDKGRGS